MTGRDMRRRTVLAAGVGLPLLAGRARAASDAAAHPWIVPDLLEPARGEGGVTVYSSTNEQEALPLWNLFEIATGLKVTYVRGSDANLLGRIGIEARAGRYSWDLLNTPTVNEAPPQLLAQIDLPEAASLMPQARDAGRRWYGCYANYNTPAYNTSKVGNADLPKSYEAFLDHPEWAGRIAVEPTDREWLYALCQARGEAAGMALVREIMAKLRPVVVDGHLAIARAVSAGEYLAALNNYTMLTLNMRLAGGATNFWVLDPVALFFGAVGVNLHAPHPNAARLAANFMLSREAQGFAARTGRLPTRDDVASIPPEALPRLRAGRSIAVDLSPEAGRKWQAQLRGLLQSG
jgi:iron(III) transport system substrate-binding protein